ncbi:MAG: CvpA family protein [Buchnera aphidicola (Acyrthosiphon caraganae)]|uniref:CvpA family protein n=1 Tax=Buchnera aphidicola TaxID=9 RepID=UPI0002ECE8A9|nr:CvpA family protein [Buchnera aphidicola]WAI18120.1 MAG: CvpA family protein [Buchnera aphidicola (Acyrthosiphon caraganae)]
MYFFIKKIITAVKLSYYNIYLGGLFGVFRGILIVFFYLFIFSYFNRTDYNYYINNSILISFFLKYKKYFLFFLNVF